MKFFVSMILITISLNQVWASGRNADDYEHKPFSVTDQKSMLDFRAMMRSYKRFHLPGYQYTTGNDRFDRSLGDIDGVLTNLLLNKLAVSPACSVNDLSFDGVISLHKLRTGAISGYDDKAKGKLSFTAEVNDPEVGVQLQKISIPLGNSISSRVATAISSVYDFFHAIVGLPGPSDPGYNNTFFFPTADGKTLTLRVWESNLEIGYETKENSKLLSMTLYNPKLNDGEGGNEWKVDCSEPSDDDIDMTGD